MDDDQTNPTDPQGQDNSSDSDMVDPDDVKHQQSKPPSVTGEENVSGDMPAEPADIDEELEKVGKDIDPEHPKPLGED